jgi:uncharacterized RDD family membrane protein YckC
LTVIDTRLRIETPEGVELSLRLAGPFVRFYAWLIDLLIRFGIYIGLFFVLQVGLHALFLHKVNTGIFLIALFLVEWFYPVYFELRHHGMTPGKKAMKIRVVHDDGTEIGWRASFIRNLLRYIDLLPVYVMVQGGGSALLVSFGLFMMLFNRQFKRLGDMAGGSVVIHQEQAMESPVLRKAHPAALPVPLNTEEQKALIEFSERAASLTPERQQELANYLQVLTGSQNGPAVDKLHQYANWLIGRR